MTEQRECPGCGHRVAVAHLACVCPGCRGPKRPRSVRCSICAGRGAKRGGGGANRTKLQVVELPTLQMVKSRTERWAIVCINCGREEFRERVDHGPLLFWLRCLPCGGRRFAEIVPADGVYRSPIRASRLHLDDAA